jgi:catechol 2,3-dioxygenase-like lactoylglutathione lyase family enzyme
VLSHVEIYVSDLKRSIAFWQWFLELIGYEPFQSWAEGRSWKRDETYIVFVQAPPDTIAAGYERRRIGLNHLAFHAKSQEQVDSVTQLLRERGVRILYEDRHPHAGGGHAVFFEDPDRIKVELVADIQASSMRRD